MAGVLPHQIPAVRTPDGLLRPSDGISPVPGLRIFIFAHVNPKPDRLLGYFHPWVPLRPRAYLLGTICLNSSDLGPTLLAGCLLAALEELNPSENRCGKVLLFVAPPQGKGEFLDRCPSGLAENPLHNRGFQLLAVVNVCCVGTL